jgi:hypothetical protein
MHLCIINLLMIIKIISIICKIIFFSNVTTYQRIYNITIFYCLISDADRRSILDQVLRCYVLDIVLSKPSNLYDVCNMWTSFTIELVRNEMCTAIMPVVILSDMFDVTTMDVCEKMFDHVESNVNVLKEPQFFMACKNNLLRMCNGNILFFLFCLICY